MSVGLEEEELFTDGNLEASQTPDNAPDANMGNAGALLGELQYFGVNMVKYLNRIQELEQVS